MIAHAEPKIALRRSPAVAIALFTIVALLCMLGAAPASAQSFTFAFTGAEQSYSVPADVHLIHVVAVGAEGGTGSSSGTGSIGGGEGGLGARLEADLAVAPRQVLFIEVGGAGASGIELTRLGAGGFNGGGSSNNGSLEAMQFTSFPGGGGGGATDIRTCSRDAASCGDGVSSLESRLLVAGGGGGGGALGAPGGYADEDGVASRFSCGGVSGEGGAKGVKTAGGAGGIGAPTGLAGGLGVGGNATPNQLNAKPGGGGGGGYFGGGAGGSGCVGGGGGGGASFAATSATSISLRRAATGVAEVVITPGFASREPEAGPGGANGFRLGKLTRNRRKGTARLLAILPGPGTLSLNGRGLVPRKLSIRTAGRVRLPIKARGTAARRLLATGKTRLRARITFRPSGAGAIAKTRVIKLIKKRARPH